MAFSIRVRRFVLDRMIEHARSNPSIECCGLMAGTGGVVTEIFPARNALGSATAYEITPRELFGLFRQMRACGLEHLGIYHSHPATENFPSARDLEQAFYPEAVYFIISPRADAPRPARAFRIARNQVEELEILPE